MVTPKVKALFNMAAEGETCVAKMSTDSDDFQQVRRKSRKRKMVEDKQAKDTAMDTSDSAPKRPSLPQISGERLMVISSNHNLVCFAFTVQSLCSCAMPGLSSLTKIHSHCIAHGFWSEQICPRAWKLVFNMLCYTGRSLEGGNLVSSTLYCL